jgi:hypothetical protein
MPPAEPEQTTLQAMASGLNPTEGKNAAEKVGPLIILVLYVALVLLTSFDIAPNPSGIVGLIALLGPVVGGWIGRLGSEAR